jgi:hypothetical protein
MEKAKTLITPRSASTKSKIVFSSCPNLYRLTTNYYNKSAKDPSERYIKGKCVNELGKTKTLDPYCILWALVTDKFFLLYKLSSLLFPQLSL